MLTFIENRLHDKTTNEKGKVVTDIHNAIPGHQRNAGGGHKNP